MAMAVMVLTVVVLMVIAVFVMLNRKLLWTNPASWATLVT
jgi:hypothetical protein